MNLKHDAKAEKLRFALGHKGYRVFRNVVPEQNIKAAVDAICRFTGTSLDDEESWSQLPSKNGGVVPLHHDQSFWNNASIPQYTKHSKRFTGMESSG